MIVNSSPEPLQLIATKKKQGLKIYIYQNRKDNKGNAKLKNTGAGRNSIIEASK